MKLINKFRSPNFNGRKNTKVKFIIIHYTALKNSKEAISYLCDKKRKVSCHYLISQTGDIYSLVDEKKRAWHAGLSYWNNIEDINSYSIGIELDYSTNNKNNKFTKNMIKSLKYLIGKLTIKYQLKNINILAHSDVAPLRKKDPGLKFPWKKFENIGLVFKVKQNFDFDTELVIGWFKKNDLKSKKEISIFILSFIGYNTKNLFNEFKFLKKIIINYQSRFIQSNVNGKIDTMTYKFLLKHFVSLVLTKL